jgi:hypothetical protein
LVLSAISPLNTLPDLRVITSASAEDKDSKINIIKKADFLNILHFPREKLKNLPRYEVSFLP